MGKRKKKKRRPLPRAGIGASYNRHKKLLNRMIDVIEETGANDIEALMAGANVSAFGAIKLGACRQCFMRAVDLVHAELCVKHGIDPDEECGCAADESEPDQVIHESETVQ